MITENNLLRIVNFCYSCLVEEKLRGNLAIFYLDRRRIWIPPRRRQLTNISTSIIKGISYIKVFNSSLNQLGGKNEA